eukprot:m.11381 g.11381  ORF g.11381 m.11381 type:complete len:126 (+) comp3828_c0_seq1:94-471(+)
MTQIHSIEANFFTNFILLKQKHLKITSTLSGNESNIGREKLNVRLSILEVKHSTKHGNIRNVSTIGNIKRCEGGESRNIGDPVAKVKKQVFDIPQRRYIHHSATTLQVQGSNRPKGRYICDFHAT